VEVVESLLDALALVEQPLAVVLGVDRGAQREASMRPV
jgi:hypothetical protein